MVPLDATIRHGKRHSRALGTQDRDRGGRGRALRCPGGGGDHDGIRLDGVRPATRGGRHRPDRSASHGRTDGHAHPHGRGDADAHADADPQRGPAPTPTPSPPSPPKPTATPIPKPTPIPPANPVRPPSTSGGSGDSHDYHQPDDYHGPLTGVYLSSQIAEADRITAALSASTSKVAVATRKMDLLAEKSNVLLESLAAAKESERGATQEATRARADLAALDTKLESARAVVREWVFLVYSGGAGGSDIAFMIEAMASRAEDVGDPLGDLSYLTEQRTRALQEVRELTAEQVRLTAASEAAVAEAAAATVKIAADSSALGKVVAAQRELVGELRTLQIEEVEKAGPIAAVLVGARTPKAKEAALRLRDALVAVTGKATDIGEPCSDDAGLYPNGLYPPSALCPLWGAPARA